MLSNEALQSALPLTSVLDDKKLFLVPVAGTWLEQLVGATRSDPLMAPVGDNGERNIDLTTIEYLANAKDPVLKTCPHDQVMDEVTNICIKAVQGHIQAARSVVAPAVAELVEKTAANLREITASSLLGMNVVQIVAPQPMQLQQLQTAVSRFSDAPYDIPRLMLNLPDMTAKDIVAAMCTGAGTLDAAIEEWAAHRGETFFLNLWQSVFQIKHDGKLGGKVKTFRDWVEDREDGLHNATAIFLLARKLCEAPPEGTEMALPVYEKAMAEYRNQAAGRLTRGFAELDRIKRTKQMVIRIEGATTYVNDVVYRDWIDAGGDNDVLFGNTLEEPSLATVDTINAAAERLRAKWARHAAFIATVESNRSFNRTKELLRRNFVEQMRAIDPGEEATIGNRETVIKLFDEQLETVRADDIKDLWSLCLKLVCRSRFYRSDAERILAGIERVKRENPSIDVREAAAIAVIGYVSYWVASQYKVQSL